MNPTASTLSMGKPANARRDVTEDVHAVSYFLSYPMIVRSVTSESH